MKNNNKNNNEINLNKIKLCSPDESYKITWSEEEIERLKNFFEEIKNHTNKKNKKFLFIK